MKGTYCLIIKLKEDIDIKVGSIGVLYLKKGFYIYVGSALNSLESRVKRHLSSEKKIHWHIDYLLTNTNTNICEVLFSIGSQKIECPLAAYISKKGIEIPNFGCSDCKCKSHLFYFKEYNDAIKYTQNAFENLNLKVYDLEYLLNSKIK